ncbi:hypothetical protein [Citricoccus sp. K5]|uniref:hypothetical protein n=1 Tax=Citricoccus sp. K5 TaxID=2653135 RepID=UPI0012F3DA36|nr:hypothetical protein [Citricoccus sp. K5]VXB80791.1 conserved hypothetical protein [Citricoccus sp. K5]
MPKVRDATGTDGRPAQDGPGGRDAAAAGNRRRRTLGPAWAWWGGGAALSLVAGGIAITTVNTTVYSPESQVEDYLAALTAGEGGTAVALASGDGSAGSPAELAPGTATDLLQGEPLISGMAALGDLTVSRGEDTPDGRSTEVLVGYTVDGEEHSTTFTVERTGRDWLFFDRWRMAEVPVQSVQVVPTPLPPEAASGPLTASVNGVQAPLVAEQEETPGRTFAVLPPMVVEASFESAYLQAEPARLVVDHTAAGGTDAEASTTDPSADSLTLDLALQYTDAVSAEVNEQLDRFLSGCTEQKVLNPAGCPMGYDTVNRIPPESITWSMAGDPQASVHELPAQGDDPTAVAPVEAEAILSLSEIDLVTGEQHTVEHREPFTLEADLTVTPDSVRYTPNVP